MPSEKYSWFFASDMSTNGKTAMLFSAERTVSEKLVGERPYQYDNNAAARAEQHATALAAASFRLRFDHRQARTGGETRRATMGRPSIQRSRSTARSPAERYRAFGSRSRQRSQIVSTSRSSAGASERNFSAGFSLAC